MGQRARGGNVGALKGNAASGKNLRGNPGCSTPHNSCMTFSQMLPPACQWNTVCLIKVSVALDFHWHSTPQATLGALRKAIHTQRGAWVLWKQPLEDSKAEGYIHVHFHWVYYKCSDVIVCVCSKYSKSCGIKNEIETIRLKCVNAGAQRDDVKTLSAFPNLIGPLLSLMEFWWVSINKKCLTYDTTRSILKHTGQHVPISEGSLNNWLPLTRTFQEEWPRKGYATRQTCSWPLFHNRLGLSPLMILTPFSPF